MRIGIVGGGQLGRMLTDAVHKLGFSVTVLDPTENSPAAQVADKQIVGSFKDPAQIEKLAHEVDVVTFEIESADAKTLQKLEDEGIPVYPSASTLSIIKDKFKQSEFLQNNNIPVAEFISVDTKEDIENAASKFGYPILLKARFDAYDGRGNALIKNPDDIPNAMKKLEGRQLYVEKFVPFVKELAVVCARDAKGNIVTYPVVETIHKNNICHIVIAPAEVSDAVKKNAELLAHKVMEILKGVGVFAIEMFVTGNGEIIINEIAPRVHNSGHWTIEGSQTSQFENHIRAVTGLQLGDTAMITPNAVMVNILGEREGKADPQGINAFKNSDDVFMHIYGKLETKVERKMGHITVLGNSPKETLEKGLEVRKSITI